MVAASALFDPQWYRQRYPDVALCRLDPIDHYLVAGALLGRDPGPSFSTTAYLDAHPEVAAAGMNPLVHYERFGRSEGRAIEPAGDDRAGSTHGDSVEPVAAPSVRSRVIAGAHMPQPSRPRILLVGHAGGASLFGAERSFLHVLEALHVIGFDVVAVLPSDDNPAYVDRVLAGSIAVHIAPVPRRRPRRPADERLVEHYRHVIRLHGVCAVHANTVVPREPVLAARSLGLPVVVHAREVPTHDPVLCDWLETTPEELAASVLADADHVVAVSRSVASAFPLDGRTTVAPNVADVAEFHRTTPQGPVRVALIGNTVEKKGVLDFVAMARLLEPRIDATFLIIGQPSPLTLRLRAEGLPANVVLAGYVDSSAEAQQMADVVVSMTTTYEAYGRSVLEAMAAGNPVVAYDRGGFQEMVDDGVTGFLVAGDDVTMFARRVEELCFDESLRTRMGDAARAVVAVRNSPASLAATLASVYRTVLPPPEIALERRADLELAFASRNLTGHREPFYIGNRARFAHNSGVAFLSGNRLACVSLLGQQMFLVRHDPEGGTLSVIDRIDTVDGDTRCSTDLIDSDGADRLVTPNCERLSVTTYRVVDDHLVVEQSVGLDGPDAGYCHGAVFVPDHPDLIAVATTTGDCSIRVLSLSQRRSVARFVDPGWLPKDLCFLGPRLMIVAQMRRPVGREPGVRHDARLVTVQIDDDWSFRTVATIDIPDNTVDGCSSDGRRVVVAVQSDDTVLEFAVEGATLRQTARHRGFSFPHAAAVSPDGRWLAVANYGTNTLVVRPIAVEISRPDAPPASP